jgi:hypothetical protein
MKEPEWQGQEIIARRFQLLADTVARQIGELPRDPRAVLDVQHRDRKIRLRIDGSTDEWLAHSISDADLLRDFDIEAAAAEIIAGWLSAKSGG